MFSKALIIALFKSASEILDFASSKVNFIFLLNESYKLPAKSLQMNNFMKKTSKNFYKETCSRKSNRERELFEMKPSWLVGWMKVGYHFWRLISSDLIFLSFLSLYLLSYRRWELVACQVENCKEINLSWALNHYYLIMNHISYTIF